jgi:integral membrane protein
MSIIEAVTYLALVVATVVKYAEGDDRGVAVLGPIHGVLFLIFAALLLVHHRDLGWPLWKAVMAMVIGSLPFGGFWVERKWLAPLDGRAALI